MAFFESRMAFDTMSRACHVSIQQSRISSVSRSICDTGARNLQGCAVATEALEGLTQYGLDLDKLAALSAVRQLVRSLVAGDHNNRVFRTVSF